MISILKILSETEKNDFYIIIVTWGIPIIHNQLIFFILNLLKKEVMWDRNNVNDIERNLLKLFDIVT